MVGSTDRIRNSRRSQDINGTKSFGAKPFLNFGQVKAGEIHNKEADAGQRLASFDNLWNDYQVLAARGARLRAISRGRLSPGVSWRVMLKIRVCVRRRLNRGDVNFSRCSICSKTR